MAKKDLKSLAEPLLNSTLKNAKYADLKKYALDLEIDLKSLKKLNENNLRKAIKEKLASQPVAVSAPKPKTVAVKSETKKGPVAVPFDQLENQSLTFKINYGFHHGVPKETIMEKLNITAKRYVDVTWLYANAGYKQKIENFLAASKN